MADDTLIEIRDLLREIRDLLRPVADAHQERVRPAAGRAGGATACGDPRPAFEREAEEGVEAGRRHSKSDCDCEGIWHDKGQREHALQEPPRARRGYRLVYSIQNCRGRVVSINGSEELRLLAEIARWTREARYRSYVSGSSGFSTAIRRSACTRRWLKELHRSPPARRPRASTTARFASGCPRGKPSESWS